MPFLQEPRQALAGSVNPPVRTPSEKLPASPFTASDAFTEAAAGRDPVQSGCATRLTGADVPAQIASGSASAYTAAPMPAQSADGIADGIADAHGEGNGFGAFKAPSMSDCYAAFFDDEAPAPAARSGSGGGLARTSRDFKAPSLAKTSISNMYTSYAADEGGTKPSSGPQPPCSGSANGFDRSSSGSISFARGSFSRSSGSSLHKDPMHGTHRAFAPASPSTSPQPPSLQHAASPVAPQLMLSPPALPPAAASQKRQLSPAAAAGPQLHTLAHAAVVAGAQAPAAGLQRLASAAAPAAAPPPPPASASPPQTPPSPPTPISAAGALLSVATKELHRASVGLAPIRYSASGREVYVDFQKELDRREAAGRQAAAHAAAVGATRQRSALVPPPAAADGAAGAPADGSSSPGRRTARRPSASFPGGADIAQHVPSIHEAAQQLYTRFLQRASGNVSAAAAAAVSGGVVDGRGVDGAGVHLADSPQSPRSPGSPARAVAAAPPSPQACPKGPRPQRVQFVTVSDLERALLERARGGRFR